MTQHHPVFIPGPTNIPERLRHSMNMPTVDHRAPDFAPMFAQVRDGTKKVFETTSGEVVIFPASGTGGWEAAVTNTLSPGDKVLVARYGVFSHKWIDLCQRHGLDVQIIDVPWGTGAPAEAFEEALKADTGHEIKALLVTHNETATGVMSDIGAVRAAMDAARHPALLMVDCVSSLASVPFHFDEWGVDLAVSGSQKGFMLHTGMAIVCISQKALAAMETAKLPRTFFDFNDMLTLNASGGYPYTPPVALIYGLRDALDMLFEEGLENVYARHHHLANGVRAAVTAWGLELVAQSPELYSDTVSTIYVPEGFDSDALTDHAYHTYRMSFGVGLGQLQGRAFRIGHLGSLSDVTVLTGLATIEMAMADLKYPITLGSGVAAAQEVFRAGGAQAMKSAA